MPIVPPTQEELFQDFKEAMEAVGFTHWSQGSRIGAIGRTQAAYLEELWQNLAQVEENLNPSTARGIYLNRIGETFGITRLPAQVATTLGRGPSVQFTNNGGTSVTLPSGTRVWNPDRPEVAFFTVQSLTLGAGQQGYADVQAGGAGELHNIGANVLTHHNAGMGQVSVTNILPIGGGTWPESDESYRFRIVNALSARSGATVVAIQQALLKVPGVRDVLVRNMVRGNGSLDVIVVPVARTASQELLDACEAAMAEIAVAGIDWRVLQPVARRVDMDIQLQMRGSADISQLRILVDQAVRGYVDNLRVNDGGGGSDLIYNELISRIMDASPDILDSAVSLRVDGEAVLQSNLTAGPGERFVSGALSVL